MRDDDRMSAPEPDWSPSGAEYELAVGPYRASVSEVGASLRALTHDGRDLVVPWPRTQPRPLSRGAVLAPWPNRIEDGRYTLDGETHQLALTEPERHHAMHGLVQWARFEPVDADSATSADPGKQVALRHRLVPQQGYEWELEITVTYHLDTDGLSWSVHTRNSGTGDAPYGVAPHPYLRGGTGGVDDWTVRVPAAQYLEVTEDRLLPVALRDVEATPFDLRRPAPLVGVQLDHAFTALRPDADGSVHVDVTDETGAGARVRWDAVACPWVQVHTADRPDPEDDRVGLAVEPMTCPPNAFASGTDLIRLGPGDEHEVTWHLSALAAAS